MSPCLLVVDDDAALNLALCAHFEDRGWQATGAVSYTHLTLPTNREV